MWPESGAGGWDFSLLSEHNFARAQASMMRMQMAMEDAFTATAGSYGAPAVVIFDRGIMDGRAFMSQQQWQQLQAELGFNVERERDECVLRAVVCWLCFMRPTMCMHVAAYRPAQALRRVCAHGHSSHW